VTFSPSSKIEVDDEGTMEAVVGNAGRNVAQGFEYQFLCTLEYALNHLLDPSFDFAAVSVEEPSDEVGADKEIVDFGIHDPDRCVLAVQVKSGVAGSEMRATQAVQILLRLLTRSAEWYAVITNRSAGYRMQELIELLRGYAAQTTSREATRQLLVTLVAGSEETRRKVLAKDDIWWERPESR
jgi:hypothetical protein